MKSNAYKFYVSSWRCKRPEDNVNCIGVVEQQVVENEDGSKTSKDVLKLYDDPVRPFWVTKPEYRTFGYKKEFGKLSECDRYMCRDSEVSYTLANALGYGYRSRKVPMFQLCESPYVYGADMDIETLIKQNYVAHTPSGKVATFTRGGFDIETEVRGDERIIAITFIHEHQIFTAALAQYCKIYDDPNKGPDHPERFKQATEEDVMKTVNDMLGDYLKQHEFEVNFHIADTELHLIKWIFDRIHECKTNFIGVWNMGFDIPRVIKRIEACGGDPAKIMCHPDVPNRFKVCQWREDKTVTQHFTDKWHWLNCSGYSQFIDSMCLYARLRKVYGRDSSYSLDDISTKELGQGKLHFGGLTNHWFQQNFNFLPYIAYNINDVMIMELMEWKNNDLTALNALSGLSLPSQFSKQTVMFKNNAYDYAKQHGYCPASAGGFTDFDKEMPKAGGTVLPPNKATGIGTHCVKEFDDISTQVSLYTNDLDFSSMYPSTVSMSNVSKETCLLSVLGINGFSKGNIERLFGSLNQPELGAVDICDIFYGLPGYTDALHKFEEEVLKIKK